MLHEVMRITAVRRALAAIRRYRAVGLAFFIFVVIGTIWYTFTQEKLFRAHSVIELRWNPYGESFPFRDVSAQEFTGYWSFDEFRNTQMQVIASRRVLQRVVDVLGYPDLNSEMIAGKLQVSPVPDSRLIRIGVIDTDPKRAANIANTVAQAYTDIGVENRVAWIQQVVDWLRDRIDGTQEEIGRSQRTLYDFQKEMGSINLEKDKAYVEQEIDALHQQYVQVHTQRIQLEARYKEMLQLAKEGTPGLDKIALAMAVESEKGAVGSVQLDLMQLESTLSSLAAVYGKSHPEMLAVQNRIDTLREQMRLAATQRITGAKTQMDIAMAEEEKLLAAIESKVKSALERSKVWLEYQDLVDQTQGRRQFYDVLLERFKEVDITRDLNREQAVIIEMALTPMAPFRPNIQLNLALGVLLAVGGSIGMALLWSVFQQGVQNGEDLEAAIGVRALVELPYMQLDSVDYPVEQLMLYDSESPLADAFRMVRNHILFTPKRRHLRSLLFTGAHPLEGKTTIANNIAIATAQAGKSVLLIDADFRKHMTSKVWEMKGRRGFADVLAGNARWQDVVQATIVPNLSLLTAGGDPNNPPELFQKEALERIMPGMQQEFEIIIFDGSPLLLVADSMVVSSVVDETFIIMEAGRIHKRDVRHLIASLEKIGQPQWEIILNKVTVPSASGFDRYGYGYGYGYGRRGPDPEDVAAGNAIDSRSLAV